MKKIILLIVLFSFIHSAFAVIFDIVPFALPITLQPRDIIIAAYAFGDHPVIYCYDNEMQIDPPVGFLTYPLNGQELTIFLSQFQLVTNSSFGDHFANPEGTLRIENVTYLPNSGPPRPIVVDCQFGF